MGTSVENSRNRPHRARATKSTENALLQIVGHKKILFVIKPEIVPAHHTKNDFISDLRTLTKSIRNV
jgi:hypothetical protein